MKIVRAVLMVIILVASGCIAVDWTPATAQNGTVYTCDDLNDPRYDGIYGNSPSFPSDSWSFEAGDTIKLVTQYPVSPPPAQGDAFMTFWIDSVMVRQAPFPGQITYTFAADTYIPPGGDPVLGWEVIDNDPNWDVSCTSAAADGTSPGCDVHLDITPDAAVGTFMANTSILWAPDSNAVTEIIMPAGKTAWVVGMDQTGEFYQFILSCSYLWVPVSALGPNYDSTWNGTPLPTTIVG